MSSCSKLTTTGGIGEGVVVSRALQHKGAASHMGECHVAPPLWHRMSLWCCGPRDHLAAGVRETEYVQGFQSVPSPAHATRNELWGARHFAAQILEAAHQQIMSPVVKGDGTLVADTSWGAGGRSVLEGFLVRERAHPPQPFDRGSRPSGAPKLCHENHEHWVPGQIFGIKEGGFSCTSPYRRGGDSEARP